MKNINPDIIHNNALLALDREDEVNYAFLKTIQNKYLSTDFMASFEKSLYRKMLDRFNTNAINYDPTQLFFPIKTYEKSDIDETGFKSIISHPYLAPFVIKGFASDTKAVKQWSIDYFKKHYANTDVAYALRTKSMQGTDGLRGKLAATVDMMFSDKNDAVYIHNTSDLFKEHPELLSDINYKKLQDFYNPLAIGAIVQLFMGRSKTNTELHCANEFNSFLMISGRKKWTFIDSCYTYALRGMLNVNALNAITEIPEHDHEPSYYEEKYPLYNRIPKLTIELEPGDMLVFSPWWWHGINNISETSIGVATRWTAIKHNTFPRGNIIYQNIQRSNKLFKQYSKKFVDAVLHDRLIGDQELLREYFGKTNTKE